MFGTLKIRRAVITDAPAIDRLLLEWLDWKPETGRLRSIRRAIKNHELIVAQGREAIIGFIHFVKHEDVIDGDPNTFITAFYVSPRHRRKGIGTCLLENAIEDSLNMGAVASKHQQSIGLLRSSTRGDILGRQSETLARGF